MKKKIFIVLFCCFFIFSAATYFQWTNASISDEKIPTDEMAQELNDILEEIPYRMGDYKYGVFDCSNESAFVFDFLTARGYKCKIMIGWQYLWEWHAWVWAEKYGKEFFIESTLKCFCHQEYYNRFIIVARFRSLNFLRFLAKSVGLPKEWDYSSPK